MILHFFPRHPMMFFMSKYKAIFKLRGFDLMNYIYIQTQTNLAGCGDVQGCKKLHTNVWQKLITVAKGKAKIEMSPFS